MRILLKEGSVLWTGKFLSTEERCVFDRGYDCTEAFGWKALQNK